MHIKQWGIYLVWLDPTQGSEQAGNRPVIVLSGDVMNDEAPVVIVVPLTSKVKRFFWGLVLEPTKINGLTETSEAMCSHIRSISKERFKKQLWSVTHWELNQLYYQLQIIITTNE